MRHPVYSVERRHRRRSSFVGRFALWLGLLVCLVVVIVVVSTPWILRENVPRLFAQHGLQASVQGGRLSLLRGELVLEGFSLGERDAPALEVAEVGIDVDLGALARGQVRIERLRIDGAEFDPQRLSSLAPGGAGAAGRAGALLADLVELEFEDLRLSLASQVADRDVRVRRLTVRNLGLLAAGGKSRIEVDVTVAGAPATVQGDIEMDGKDVTLTGNYVLANMALAGWSTQWSDTAYTLLSGTLRAQGKLTGAYRASTRRVELVLDGDTRAADLAAELAATHVTGADLSWRGSLALTWPSLDAPPNLSGEGVLGIERASIEIEGGDATVSDASWKGSVHWSQGVRAEGTVRGDRIELAGTAGRGGAQDGARGSGFRRATLEEFTFGLRVVQSLSPSTLSARAQDVVVRRVAFASQGAEVAVDGGVDQVSIDEIRAAHTGDFVIGQVQAEGMWAAQSDPGAAGAARGSWRARGVLLEGLSGVLSGEIHIARAGAQTGGLENGHGAVDLEQVRLVTVGYRHPGQLGVEEVEIDNARVSVDGEETWLDGIRAGNLYRERTGHVGAASARASTIYQVDGSHGSWEASSVALLTLEQEPAGALRAGTLELAKIVYADAATSWTARALSGKDLILPDPGGGAGLSALSLGRLEGILPAVGDVALAGIDAGGLSMHAGGATLKTLAATTFDLDDTLGNRIQAEKVVAARLEGDPSAGLRVAQVEALRLTGGGSDDSRQTGSGLRVEGLTVDAEGAVAVDSAHLAQFRHEAGTAIAVELHGVSAERLRWRPRSRLSLTGGRVGHMDVQGPAFGALRLSELETADLDWDGGRELGAGRVFVASLQSTAESPWEALAVTGHELRYRLPADLQASSVQVETLRHSAEPSAWTVDGIAAEQVRLGEGVGKGAAKLHTGAFSLRDARSVVRLARTDIEDLEVGGVDVLRAGRSSATSLALGASDETLPSRLDITEVELSAARLSHAGLLDLGDMSAAGASLVLGRDERERWLLPPFPGPGAELPGGELRIKSLVTRGPARFEFFDRETEPEFHMVFTPVALALGNLDTSLPGNVATLQVMGVHDDVMGMRVSGKLVTGLDDMNLEMRGKVTGLNLVDFNPYLTQSEPFEATAGHGDARFDFTVRNGTLTGKGGVMLSGLKLKRTIGPLSSTGLGSGRTPLNVVVRLLQDSDGNIALEFPLEARADESGFDFIELFTKTADTTLRVTANLPEKTVRGALDLVQTVISTLPGLEATHYPPVVFSPGSAALLAQSIQYLTALRQRLHDQGRLRLRLCPVGVRDDQVPDEAAWPADDGLFTKARMGVFDGPATPSDLAERRGAEVRRFLESDRAVSGERLLACEARVDDARSAVPRVEIRAESSH